VGEILGASIRYYFWTGVLVFLYFFTSYVVCLFWGREEIFLEVREFYLELGFLIEKNIAGEFFLNFLVGCFYNFFGYFIFASSRLMSVSRFSARGYGGLCYLFLQLLFCFYL